MLTAGLHSWHFVCFRCLDESECISEIAKDFAWKKKKKEVHTCLIKINENLVVGLVSGIWTEGIVDQGI